MQNMNDSKFSIDELGWCQPSRHVPSPHYDARPPASDVSLLVVHNISLPPGQFGGDSIEKFFLGQLKPSDHPFFSVIANMKVSAHCLIRRTGEVVQFVSFNDRAWHAGNSSFAGQERCNDYSIGIELEGVDSVAYEQAQYQALARLTFALQQHYQLITNERITGHQYIAPIRKTDPGLVFEWPKFRNLLNYISTEY